MPIGRHFTYKEQNTYSLFGLLNNLYFQLFGTPDIHSHIRWLAVRRIVSPWLDTIDHILDIGCGSGMFAFEIGGICKKCRRVVGIDINSDAIDAARQIASMIDSDIDFKFMQYDATKFLPFNENDFDLVLIIDIIEHVDDDNALMQETTRVLKPGGLILISVPTPNYPRVFGREFHESIGHKRDGYWLEDIDHLFSGIGIRRIGWMYHTYPPSALVCAFYYRRLRKVGKVASILSPGLRLFSFLDILWPIRDERWASSLVVLGRKE